MIVILLRKVLKTVWVMRLRMCLFITEKKKLKKTVYIIPFKLTVTLYIILYMRYYLIVITDNINNVL